MVGIQPVPEMERIIGIIPATPEHVPGMVAAQLSCHLAPKVEAGLSQREIERGGFLVHMLTAGEMEEIVCHPDVTARVQIEPSGEVGGYAIGFPKTAWQDRNPEWAGAIILDADKAPDPEDKKTALLRYVATGPNATTGAGLLLNRTIVEHYREEGYEALVGEVLESPYANLAARAVNTRTGFRRVGKIHEEYEGKAWVWTYVRNDLRN